MSIVVPQASEQTLELRLSRYVGGGMHEDIDLTNFTQQPTSFRLDLEVDADFAGQQETRGERQQRGERSHTWRAVDEDAWELTFDYRVEHGFDHQGNQGSASIHRAVTLRIEHAASPPSYQDGRIAFQLELEPHATWHTCVTIIPCIDGVVMQPRYRCRSFTGIHNEQDRRRALFLREAASFSVPGSESLTPVVTGALDQATRDLAALRLDDLDHGERAWTMGAGLPIYTALFGRDTLTAGWQAALLGPEMMRGTLLELARWQGTEHNDWRDEQPGRMLHEAHTGPLELLNYNPRQRYYGSVTTSAFYPVVVSELWHWTGDKELVGQALGPALRGLEWLDTYGDLDGDGFYEYQTRSTQGVKHQGWKDSGDAIVYADGSQVETPIATCEEQGFVYIAKLHLAEVLWWFGDADHPFPALYPQANWPQAWSASAVFCLIQALLGLYPYAPLKLLLLDPHLPEWLPELTLRNLRVGEAAVTIRFYRRADGASAYELLDRRGALHVVRQPSPWSLTAGLGERLKDALTSLLPGR